MGCLPVELKPDVGADSGSSQEKETKVFAFAGGQYTNVVNSYEVNKSTGALTPTSQPTIAGENLPMIQAVLANKKFLLSVNYSSHSLSVYSIAPATGNLTLVAHNSLGGGMAPAWVTAHPSLPVVYVAESGASKIDVVDVNPDSGAITVRGSVSAGSGVTALDINSTGTLLYSADQGVNQVGIYSVDSTGGLTLAGTAATPGGSQPNQVKVHPSGKFVYTANWGTADVTAFSVSGTTLNLVGSVSAGTGGVYMVSITPDGKNLYATKPYGANFATLSINQDTGALTYVNSETVTGAVNFAYWGNFAFLVSWQGGGGQPIQTRLYNTDTGLSAMWNQTANVVGLYNMIVVEVEQP
jgi:6-phosphogluconolactonase (cycloisomerase 2 family)